MTAVNYYNMTMCEPYKMQNGSFHNLCKISSTHPNKLRPFPIQNRIEENII